MEVTATDGALPDDTVLVVNYQGTLMERYAIAAPPAHNEDVCCRLGAETGGTLPPVMCGDSGADASSADALLCEMWTGGVAEIQITASGYQPLEQTLQPQMSDDEECGLTTVDVRVVLTRADGGAAE